MKIHRVYIEKKQGFDFEAQNLKRHLSEFLGAKFEEIANLKLLYRYDAEGLNEAQFDKAVKTTLAEPQFDNYFCTEHPPVQDNEIYFSVELLPGQYDQRADLAEQCIELAVGIKPQIRLAKVYILRGGKSPVSATALEAVKKYIINPVIEREALHDIPLTLEAPEIYPDDIPILNGFISLDDKKLEDLIKSYGFAMNLDDLIFCRSWFSSIQRDPTLAELRVLDTYWSDHCRHTTFNTILEKIEVSSGSLADDLNNALAVYEAARDEVYGKNSSRPKTLMDMAVVGAKVLRKRGITDDVEISKEINACTVKIDAEFVNDKGEVYKEPWLLYFKNETHNHPTEIEPFGGAATCLGGGIRDPLSGRSYVHQAMRITGAGDPRTSLEETIPGKLPQIKIAHEAAAGYSSYGNQIGIPAGQVSEFYHKGFLAKRMELGALVAAAPADWVIREEPSLGDLVILVGGKTGRDGIGGATGSSKSQSGEPVQTGSAAGNAIEERRIVRLFRNPHATKLIKRCNDFGAGGVSVAVGELAAGLDIDLDKVPPKYPGLNGIELAISESQERMAVVVSSSDAEAFINLASYENLEAVVIAAVTSDDPENAVLRIKWRGKTIIELSRKFLDTNGAPRKTQAVLGKREKVGVRREEGEGRSEELIAELGSLRSCSRRGLQECFDGSAGSASVLFPFGGAWQGTPECGMAALLPSLNKPCKTASIFTFGYDPDLMEKSPYLGAKGNIREALAKFACLGGDYRKARLSFQEYFPRTEDPETWGLPAAALLGALEAQLALEVPAIGGKDSMSGNYSDKEKGIEIAVPPSFIAFAAGCTPASSIRSGALSGQEGNVIVLLKQESADEWNIFKANMAALMALGAKNYALSAYPVCAGGLAASLSFMAFGNNTGLEVFAEACSLADPAAYQGSVLIEIDGKAFQEDPEVQKILEKAGNWEKAAVTTAAPVLRITGEEISLETLRQEWETPLSKVYPRATTSPLTSTPYLLPPTSYPSNSSLPTVVIPVFPGTNGEWDLQRAFCEAGAKTRLVIFRNRTKEDIARSKIELAAAIGEGQILALSSGFSAGFDPDFCCRYMANTLRAPEIYDSVCELLEKRNGLILGISGGFKVLLNLGLIPFGNYNADDKRPLITHNKTGRHISRMAETKVMDCSSPWLALDKPGDMHIIPVSHSEGCLVIDSAEAEALIKNKQVPFCYADGTIESLCSPDGRILGKIGHSERRGEFVHINIPGNKRQNIFDAGVKYFTGKS